jgi:hypothetical protein
VKLPLGPIVLALAASGCNAADIDACANACRRCGMASFGQADPLGYGQPASPPVCVCTRCDGLGTTDGGAR